MAFAQGFKARILNGDFDIAAKATTISLPYSIEMLDSTVFTSTAKEFISGLDTSTFSIDGFVDASLNTDIAAWTAAQPLTYGQNGFAIDSPVYMVNALKSSYEPGTQVGGIASFTLAGQTDGTTDWGRTLVDHAAVTADTNGTAVNGGASSANGGIAHLHVTAFSGFSGAVFIVEDSANGTSGWATIGTFTTVAGTTSQRLAITGTIRQYTRYSVDVTGTGSVTACVALARH